MTVTIKKKAKGSKPRSHQPVPGNENGRDMVTPKQVKVPPSPTQDDRALFDEQQVARAEMLMLKGVRDRRQLMTLLEVEDPRAMDRYIKRVQARWEVVGTNAHFARYRGEALARMDLVESELWALHSNSESEKIKLGAMNAAMRVNLQRCEIMGLTPKTVEMIVQQGGDNAVAVSRMAADHNLFAALANRMKEMLEQRTKVIEHEQDASQEDQG